MAAVRSIQTVAITIASGANANTATLATAVDTAKAFVLPQGITAQNATAGQFSKTCTRVALTNATTVTATREGADTNAVTLRAVVIEFASGVNAIQQGTILVPTATHTATATISAVGANAFVAILGTTRAGNGSFGASTAQCYLSSSTQVTAETGAGTGVDITVGYVVVDLDSSVVASVEQRGPTGTTGTSFSDTISSVDINRTLLIPGGGINAGSVSATFGSFGIALASATQVALARATSNANTWQVRYAVVQLASGVLRSNVQRGSIALQSAASGTATISAVNTNAAILLPGGTVANDTAPNQFCIGLELTNATTVTAALDTAAGASGEFAAWQVAEFAADATAFNLEGLRRNVGRMIR